MPEKREFKPRRRKSANRDASLIIIATEGTKTETQYFTTLAHEVNRSDIRVHVIDREPGECSPGHVIRALDGFRNEFKLRSGDELWMVIDRDQWPLISLVDVASKCAQKGYHLAVSNPAFEVWLLLHVADLKQYSRDELAELEENERMSRTRPRLEQELVRFLGAYNKSGLNMQDFLPGVENAVQLARAMDTHPEERWPRSLGTRVYQLVERILSHA